MSYLKTDKSKETQKVAAFTGEGAYHGSTKSKDAYVPEQVVPEMMPHSLNWYETHQSSVFYNFTAKFDNLYDVKKVLKAPTQEELKDEDVTFVWCPFEQAKKEAAPITKAVLEEMENHLERKKKFIYIDSKVQYFEEGDLAVDSNLWHVDGTIAIRNKLGHNILHDMYARFMRLAEPPKYLAYQSSTHCATQFITKPITINIPDCMSNFNPLDRAVKTQNLVIESQPAGSIVSFDGFSLHRAVPASSDGWRLWIRCIETDREVKLDSSIISCYQTIYRAQ
jgi:hypothetical protein